MGSKYPQSVRCCLPLWAFILEAALILVFTFFTTYELPVDQKFMGTYQVLQDLTVMAALGLGFLTSSLRRHGWSSVAFNLFMLALGVQWAVLMDGFLHPQFRWRMSINLSSIRMATMSAMAVLISAGAVLGKANLVQLAMMVLVEMTAFAAVKFLHWYIFRMEDHVTMMHVHVFAAYFGLTVAWCLSRRLPQGLDRKARMEKVQIATSPSLFAMLGTLFLWVFWPTFNSALVDFPNEKKNAVFNTYYALAASTVTATSVSALAHPQGKINMIHLHNAVLAGGVAMGAPGHLIASPWISMSLGLTAGLISIGGAKCLPVCLNRILEIQDPSGVHYTFGLPGLLGGVTYIILMTYHTFPTLLLVSQMISDIAALSFVMAAGMISGLLTGLLLNLKIWKAPHAAKYFDDQAFWEFPHLAVGF